MPSRGVRRWRQRERPEPSAAWHTAAVLLVGFAFAAGMGALTASPDAAMEPAELWILAGSFLALALTCLVAHWDVNRGRKCRQYESEEVRSGHD